MIDPEILDRMIRIKELLSTEEPLQTDKATLTKMFKKLHSDLSVIIETEKKYSMR